MSSHWTAWRGAWPTAHRCAALVIDGRAAPRDHVDTAAGERIAALEAVSICTLAREDGRNRLSDREVGSTRLAAFRIHTCRSALPVASCLHQGELPCLVYRRKQSIDYITRRS